MDTPVNGFQHEALLLFETIRSNSMLDHLTLTGIPFLVKLIVQQVQKRKTTLSLLHDVEFDLKCHRSPHVCENHKIFHGHVQAIP